MPQNLTQLKIDEISLVDKPANAEIDPRTGKKIARARVAIFKRDVEKYHPSQAREKGVWTDGGAVGLSVQADDLSEKATSPEGHRMAGDGHGKAAMAHRFAAASAKHVGHERAAKDHLAEASQHDEKSIDHYVRSLKRADGSDSERLGRLAERLDKQDAELALIGKGIDRLRAASVAELELEITEKEEEKLMSDFQQILKSAGSVSAGLKEQHFRRS